MSRRFALAGLNGFTLGTTNRTPYGQWLTGAFVELLDDGVRVRLWDVLSFETASGGVYTVPAGFVSDGSSHPKFTWSAFGGPLSGRYRRAAILHDYLLSRVLLEPGITVALAHDVFRNAMLADGVREQDADLFFTAVVGKTWWDTVAPMLGFLKSAWRVLRRVVPRF